MYKYMYVYSVSVKYGIGFNSLQNVRHYVPAARLETFFSLCFLPHFSNEYEHYIYVHATHSCASAVCTIRRTRKHVYEYACGVSCHCGSYAVVYAHWVFLMKQRTSARNKSRCSCCMFFFRYISNGWKSPLLLCVDGGITGTRAFVFGTAVLSLYRIWQRKKEKYPVDDFRC